MLERSIHVPATRLATYAPSVSVPKLSGSLINAEPLYLRMSPVCVEVKVISDKSPILAAAILPSALVSVKYKLEEPSDKLSVS